MGWFKEFVRDYLAWTIADLSWTTTKGKAVITAGISLVGGLIAYFSSHQGWIPWAGGAFCCSIFIFALTTIQDVRNASRAAFQVVLIVVVLLIVVGILVSYDIVGRVSTAPTPLADDALKWNIAVKLWDFKKSKLPTTTPTVPYLWFTMMLSTRRI